MLARSPELEARDKVLDNNPVRIGIWKCWFLRRGENRRTRRKTSRSRVENQQQTQPTYDAGSGNRTLDTLVRGERSHHCTIPAHLKETKLLKGRRRGQNYTKMSQIRIPKEINRWSTANLRVNYRDY